jgi:hypothetical protein
MKGQYFSFDAIIAAVIFIMALVALLSYWHSVKSYLDYQSDPLAQEAVRVSNLLFTPPTFTPPAPVSGCDGMTRLGFSISWDDRRVDPSLVDCASSTASTNPEWLKRVLGTPYDVALNVTDLSDTPRPTVSIGGPVPVDASEVVKMRRLATIENQTDGTSYIAAFDLSLYIPNGG